MAKCKLLFCSECINRGQDLIYLKRYPLDYGICIMCIHYYEMIIKPKIDKMTKEKIKKPRLTEPQTGRGV